MSPEGTALVAALTVRDANKRLGGPNSSVDAVKTHAFFRDVDWDKLCAPPLLHPSRAIPCNIRREGEQSLLILEGQESNPFSC